MIRSCGDINRPSSRLEKYENMEMDSLFFCDRGGQYTVHIQNDMFKTDIQIEVLKGLQTCWWIFLDSEAFTNDCCCSSSTSWVMIDTIVLKRVQVVSHGLTVILCKPGFHHCQDVQVIGYYEITYRNNCYWECVYVTDGQFSLRSKMGCCSSQYWNFN